jgi:YVTN family beta-propeller protein
VPGDRKLLPWIALTIAAIVVAGGFALADTKQTGEIGPALGITANGHALHPIGRLTPVGNFPTGSALTPNGRFLWVVDAGHGSDDVRVIDVATGAAVQTLPLPGSYGGIAFAADGRRAYVSGTPKGSSPTEGPTKGDQGDVIHVFSVDPATGRGTELNPIALPSSSGGSGRTNSLPPTSGTGSAYPDGVAISPNGKLLVTALNAADKAAVVDLSNGSAKLVATGAYPNGVAFDHGGLAYVSNEYEGTLTVIDPATASVVTTIAGFGGAGGDRNSHPEGLVADPKLDRIYVAVTNRDLIARVDTKTRRVVGTISVARPEALGAAPVKLAIARDGQTLYAADSGEDAIAAISLAKRPAAGAPVIPRAVVRVPSVSNIAAYERARRRHARNLASLRRRLLREQPVRACGGPTRRAAARYVRSVSAALRLRGARRQRALTRAKRGLARIVDCQAPGYIPNFPANAVIGKLPTAAYPSDVQVTPDGSQLLWVAAKGVGAGANPQYSFDGDKRPGVTPKNIYGTYVLDMLKGIVGTLPIPSDRQDQSVTPTADAQSHPSNGEAPPAGTPVVGPSGEPSRQIKHVFYIVKENRTYDQVFGSDPRGDGDPSLELFDDNGVPGPLGGVTPNAHKLTRTFPLLDHFYADSEVSVDGHVITSGAYATDYVQKALAANYSGRNRGMDMGIFPVTFPPNDFLFDQAVRQGISFRDYGEEGGGNSPFANDGRSSYNGVAAATDPKYPNNLFIGCTQPGGAVGNLAACTQDSGAYRGLGKTIAGQSRFNAWYPEFQAQLAAGTVPALNYMILPNDHTNGTTPNDYSPQALIADNDLALGQIVDAISHSSIWNQTAIFVVEDDSQDGADHIDAHRMPAFVISPWTKRGAVVHTRYDQYSVIRTIELMIGLHPLSLNDALATPMYDAFDTTADPAGTVYDAVAPTQDIGQINGAAAPAAKLSAALPWSRIDVVPQELSDQILWQSVHGAGSRPPAPGPGASPAEHARAVTVRAALAQHANVRALLGGGDG